MKDLLFDLEEWFSENCNGDWEHDMGITIRTLDNPGWAVSIHLDGTFLAGKDFEKIRIERTDNNWIHCHIEKKFFKGYGGPRNLREILSVFTDWAAV
jgi:hypothetical protein